MRSVETEAIIADDTKTRRRPCVSPSRPRKMPPTGLERYPMASTVNDKVSGDMPLRGGKNSLPMLRAKNPKMTKSNTSSAPPVLATRMVQRWCAVIDSFRNGSESSSMEIPDIARHNDHFKWTSRRRDVFSHHHVNRGFHDGA